VPESNVPAHPDRGPFGAALPYRGAFGGARPAGLRHLPLPPAAMPGHHGLRPLKAWRYVGVFSPELMLCVASVRIGPARQSFWAVWDRTRRRLHERTRMGRATVTITAGHVLISDDVVRLELELDEGAGVETVCRSGRSYAWTRKQGGIRARGTIEIAGEPAREIDADARAVIDDTAAYYERHTSWRWSAGVGHAADGRELAWNLVQGVNDPPVHSERTLWIDGEPRELEPHRFDPELTSAGGLRFAAEATRERRENRLVVRSSYRQPFGTFSGELGGVRLADGYGVMEEHDVWW
jgi:hypothetical protein